MLSRRYTAKVVSLCLALGVAIGIACADDSPPLSATASVLATESLLLDGAQRDGLMVVVGERGHILYSTDQGEQWVQANVPTRVLLTGVYLHDSTLGWAVGHDATILRTGDSGKNWQRIHYAPQQEAPLLDVRFIDQRNGFAVGAYGLFLRTHDGGDTWAEYPVSDTDDFHLNSINQGPDGTLFIAAEAGVVYRSDDLGETWQSMASPYHGSFFGALALAQDTWWLFGLRGHLFSTHDKGDSWTPITTETTAMLTAALKSHTGTCFIGGLAGVLLVDKHCNGQHIEHRQLPDRRGIAALLERRDGSLVVVGESGVTRFMP